MARTVAQVETDLTSLRAARSDLLTSGAVRSFAIAGKSFTFASLKELQDAETALLEELDEANLAASGSGSTVILPDLTRRVL